MLIKIIISQRLITDFGNVSTNKNEDESKFSSKINNNG